MIHGKFGPKKKKIRNKAQQGEAQPAKRGQAHGILMNFSHVINMYKRWRVLEFSRTSKINQRKIKKKREEKATAKRERREKKRKGKFGALVLGSKICVILNSY